ncbi:Ribosomal protein S18 acetylase RimI [Nitrosomonas ureae]|uniref:Ribosomal protein S18 acetylase RimI n=1 Tax=Nitrosomonas ureae TaxID=44577 RepID=A0A285BWB3_9PROT|nr:GNAT family N-acetyltransferase [Nitrosomonas ureae]SNX59591.1 Ribosomal protein S18 acetylase RimI [Nitrosomonas ureae]
MQLNILPLTSLDVSEIAELARVIWQHHYAPIISTAQIDYMLAQRYEPTLIENQLKDPNIWWRKLTLDQTIIGFSCCMLTGQPNELKIDKLYVHCDHHRKGYGAMLVADAINLMQSKDLQTLILTVNKRNHSAIAAYQQYGFEIAGDSIVDIGGGFVMNDFLMTLTDMSRWNT